MAEKMNSEFNYRYQVMGETIWEKIKVLRSFVEGRKRSAMLEQVSNLKYEAVLSKLQWLKDNNAPSHELLEQEANVREFEAHLESSIDAFRLNAEELVMLERLLAEAYEIAEPSRIPGYTDEQMFEANAANEFTVMIGKEIQAEIIANGRPSPAKIRNAMSNPYTFLALKQAGLIPAEAVMLCGNDSPLQIGLNVVEDAEPALLK
jgi:hypothetical protein